MNATLPPPVADQQHFAAPPPVQQPPLVRPARGRRIGGVCAGIADKYGWSRTTVRLVAVLSVFVPGPQVLAYLVAWVVIPGEDEVE